MAKDSATNPVAALTVREVDQVCAAARELASRDVSSLSKDQLIDVSEAIARLERVVGALGSRSAGEIARRSTPEAFGGGLARTQGHGDAPKMWSKIRGSTVTGARRSIEAGGAFVPRAPEPKPTSTPGKSTAPDVRSTPSAPPVPQPKYPEIARASLDGELSVDAAGLIVAGLNSLESTVDLSALAELEERLVTRALGMTAHEVQKMVARAVARVDQAAHRERERKNHQERYFWWKQKSNGMVTFHGELDTVTAAPIINVLEQMTTRSVRTQSRGAENDDAGASGVQTSRSDTGRVGTGDETQEARTIGQIRADALFDLARHALGCTETNRSGVRTSVIVRMDLADLLRGDGLGSVDGMEQPVSVSEARRLAGDAGLIPEVLGGDGQVLDLGRRARLFTGPQRLALLERDGGCAKCHAPPEHCEAHHIRWWESGGATDLSNGVMLCTRCHHDIHAQGWEIDATPTGVNFIPPPQIDPNRTRHSGGSIALDVDIPSLEPDLPRITAEDEAMVRAWVALDRGRETGIEKLAGDEVYV